eukprot:4359160-Pyramimonas_sp.AAC.1
MRDAAARGGVRAEPRGALVDHRERASPERSATAVKALEDLLRCIPEVDEEAHVLVVHVRDCAPPPRGRDPLGRPPMEPPEWGAWHATSRRQRTGSSRLDSAQTPPSQRSGP